MTAYSNQHRRREDEARDGAVILGWIVLASVAVYLAYLGAVL